MVVWCGWGVFSAGGANRGTDTIFGRPHRRGGTGVVPDSAVRQNRVTDTIFPSARRTVEAAGTHRYGDRHDLQARCPMYRSGTSDVQRST